jgi:hypothetical protein
MSTNNKNQKGNFTLMDKKDNRITDNVFLNTFSLTVSMSANIYSLVLLGCLEGLLIKLTVQL